MTFGISRPFGYESVSGGAFVTPGASRGSGIGDIRWDSKLAGNPNPKPN